jgi:hypothetical protein
MFDDPVLETEPLTNAERDAITADLQAKGMPPDEAKAYLEDDGLDGARQWYRSYWRQNRELQDDRARRAMLGDARARDTGVSQMASAVVARDVAAHGSGARLGKPIGTGATFNPWVGILLGGMAAAAIGVVLGLLTAGPSNAAGQPTGRVGVDQVAAGQPAAKLKIASGSAIDFTFNNLANSTCPAGSIQGGFGAGYMITLNPDGSITFTHQAASPFAPDMTGTTSGTSVKANGANNIEKQTVTGNFDRLGNPTSFTGKAALTLPAAGGKDCTAGFDAKADIKGASGGAVAPPPSLADVIRPGSGLGTTSGGTQTQNGLAWLAIAAAAVLIAAAVGIALSERPPQYERGAEPDDNDDGDIEPYDDQSQYDTSEEERAVEVPPGGLGFDPVPPGPPAEPSKPTFPNEIG